MTVQVSLLGAHLDRALQVDFLDSHITGRVLSSDYTGALVELRVPPGTPVGLHYFRLISPRGASNLQAFRVGSLPHRNEKEPNSRFEHAEIINLPLTLNARLDTPDDFDVFRFEVQKGSTWIFDVRAMRNGNSVDTTLLLFDSQQRKIAHSEDYFLIDPLISYRFAEAGWYYALVQSKGNGPNFAYQLDIRSSPHLETIAPLSFVPGVETDATLFGEGLLDESARFWFSETGMTAHLLEARGRSARARIRVDEHVTPGLHRLALVTTEGLSDSIPFRVNTTPRHVTGQLISPPVSISGIATFPEPVRFHFKATANQRLVFEVHAAQLGSPVDSILRILDSQGKAVATNDDTSLSTDAFNQDSRIVHTFEQPGEYALEMRNLVQVTGENFPYELTVRSPQPDVHLWLTTDRAHIYPNGTRRLKVKAERVEGFDKPVRISVVASADAIRAEAIEIGPKENEADLLLNAGECQPGTTVSVKITGRSGKVARQLVGVGESTADVRTLTLVVAEKPRFAIEAGLKSFSLVRGGSVKVPVRIEREDGFNKPLRVRLDNLPAGLRSEPVAATPGVAIVTLTLEASADSKPGSFSQIILLGSSDDGEIEEAPRVDFAVN